MTENSVCDLRCTHCGKVLAKDKLDAGHFEIKCLRCGTLNILFRDTKEQIIVTDPEGKILFANGLTEVVTGYSLEEIVGKTPSLWGGIMPKEFYATMWHQIKIEKKTISVEVTNRRKNGEVYVAHLTISPVLDTQGEIKFFIGIESIKNNI